MKRIKPDATLEQFIEDLSHTKPATRTLVKGAFEYVNNYNNKLLLKLLHRLLRRLMPHAAVDVFGVFLGNMSIDAQQRLQAYYGDAVKEFFGPDAMKLYKRWEKDKGTLN